MTNLSDLTLLIVDPSEQMGFSLRKSFVDAGANTHVVSNFAVAEKLVETKKIDAALVHFSTDADTVAFCKLLSAKNIPCIFTSEPPPRYSKRRPMSEAIVAIQAVLAEQPQRVSSRVAHH